MALVLKTDTKLYSPTYNRMDVVIFQDSAVTRLKPDYKYIFDIKINDNKNMTVRTIRTKVIPDPIQGFGLQDLSAIVQSYVNEIIIDNTTDLGFNLTADGIIKYWVEYGEEYRLTSSDPIVEYANELTGSDKYAWGASFEKRRWIDFYNYSLYTNYLFNTNDVGEFLTNNKLSYVQLTDLGWHWFLTNIPADVDYMKILTYDDDGALIDTYHVQNSSSLILDQSRLVALSTAPQSLNNIKPADVILGTQPIVDNSVVNYTIQCFRGDNTPVGEILYFTLQEQCFYEVYRLHFENEYGAYDSFNFRLNSKKSSDAERKTYITNQNLITSDGITYDHSIGSKVNYYTKFTDKITLRSDFLTEEQNNWLKELSFSPRGYIEFADYIGAHTFQSCLIKNVKWTENKTQVDKLFTIEIEIEFDDNFRQAR